MRSDLCRAFGARGLFIHSGYRLIALSRHLSEKLFFFRPTWKFITPRAPWVRGWRERLIQSVKKGLRKTLGLRLITAVELTTVLTEIEQCINSRPLTYISDNPEYDVITPEGFSITKAAISFEQALKAHSYHALSQEQGTILEYFLLHLIDTDTPSKTTDDLPSGNSETTAKQAEALADPIPSSSKEPTDAMGEKTARTGDSGSSPAYRTRSGRRVKAIQRSNL